MQLKWIWIFIPVFLLSLPSCEDDIIEDDLPTCVKDTYGTGVYISNEGPFSSGSGTITYFDSNNDLIVQNSFSANNCELPLGNIVQSISFHNDLAFIVVNNANRIIVADGETLELQDSITGFELPRYFLGIDNNRALVSQWGADGLSGSVAVVDLNSFEISRSIPCGSGPENMFRNGDFVLVANEGGFGRDSVISVIHLGQEEVVATIPAGHNPHSFVRDVNQQIWCLSKGYKDWNDPSQSKPGQLSRIEANVVAHSVEIPDGSRWLAINGNGDELYYLNFGGIFRYSISNDVLDTAPYVDGNFYSLAIDPSNSILYASDAKDYASTGSVSRYNALGEHINTFDAGIIPGGFWFRK